jgi:hypothetical protein
MRDNQATLVEHMSHVYGEHSMTAVTNAYGLRGRTMIDRDVTERIETAGDARS